MMPSSQSSSFSDLKVRRTQRSTVSNLLNQIPQKEFSISKINHKSDDVSLLLNSEKDAEQLSDETIDQALPDQSDQVSTNLSKSKVIDENPIGAIITSTIEPLIKSHPWPSNITPYPSKLFKSNRYLEVCIDKNSPKRGRGLYSKADKTIKPGFTILSLAPHVAVLDTNLLSTRCSSCFLESQDFDDSSSHQIRRCTKCKVIAYCGENCQRLDWISHKLECKALVNYAQLAQSVTKANQKSKSRLGSIGNFTQSNSTSTIGNSNSGNINDNHNYWDDINVGFNQDPDNDYQICTVPSSSVRAMARLIWNKSREEKKDPNWWNGLEELHSQWNACNQAQKEKLMGLSMTLSRYIGAQILIEAISSASSLLPFCSRFLDNSFTLTSPTLDNIGVVLSGSAAFINHSCSPNAVVIFPEGGEGASKKSGKEWVKVIALKDIEPGDEILTSYVDLSVTRKERQKDLAQRMQFICDCELCVKSERDPSFVDPRDALKCPKCTNWFSLDSKFNNRSNLNTCLSERNLNSDLGLLQAGPSSSSMSTTTSSSLNTRSSFGTNSKNAKKEIKCPDCGFSRLIDIEGQRLAIKKSGLNLDPHKEPEKAAYYAEKAIEWLELKLLPFRFGVGFYPILNLRRLKMISKLICHSGLENLNDEDEDEDEDDNHGDNNSDGCRGEGDENVSSRSNNNSKGLKNEKRRRTENDREDEDQLISGVHLIYGFGHPISIITKSTITKWLDYYLKLSIDSGFFNIINNQHQRLLNKKSNNNSRTRNHTGRRLERKRLERLGSEEESQRRLEEERRNLESSLKMLRCIKEEYQLKSFKECLIGFGSINNGGRLGRYMNQCMVETEREIDTLKQKLRSIS